MAKHHFLKDSLTITLYLLDFIGFWPTFGLFHYTKLPSYKRVRWGRLAGPQSHKDPCSVAALLRENLGSLVNIAEIFTNIHAVLWQNFIKVSYILLQKFHKNWACFVSKFPQKNKAALLKNLHQYLLLWKMSTIKLFCLKIFTIICFVGKISTLTCFVEKFPQNFTFLLNFLNISLCWTMSTKLSCVGKF